MPNESAEDLPWVPQELPDEANGFEQPNFEDSQSPGSTRKAPARRRRLKRPHHSAVRFLTSLQ